MHIKIKSEVFVKKVFNHTPVVSLDEQTGRLLKFLGIKNQNQLYKRAELINEHNSPLSDDVRIHWCVFPHPSLLWEKYSSNSLLKEYDEATRVAALLLSQCVPTRNNLSGKVELSPVARTKEAIHGAVKQQGPLYFLPVQFGSRYSNMKFRAVPEKFGPHEYGLTLLQCIVIALTHRIELTYNEAWDDIPSFAMVALGETCVVPDRKRVIDHGPQVPSVHAFGGQCILSAVSVENGDQQTGVPTFFWKAGGV